MGFGLFDDRDGVEHSGVRLVEISNTFVAQDNLFVGTPPFDAMFLGCSGAMGPSVCLQHSVAAMTTTTTAVATAADGSTLPLLQGCRAPAVYML